MNALSVAQSYVPNQPKKPSWIDDPFDLKGFVTGVTKVSHERNLDDYALELVGQYAKYSCEQYELFLDMLPEEEQNELARLYIESIDREIEWACYGSDESINNDFLCALLSMLKNDCEETRENFAAITRKNVIVYYKESLEVILNTSCDAYLHATMNENGYYARQDDEHGDVVWGKF